MIIPNDETRTIKILRLLQTPSPMVKLSKKPKTHVTSTPKRIDFEIKANEILVAEKIETLPIDNTEPLELMCDETESLIDEIQNLLPSVIETVRKENKEDMYLKFNHLLAENKLPLTYIAYLLFKDIVEWYSLDQSTSMRYSPEVKKFWRVGFKLCKGRFLRFMCGMKNQGQDGCLQPSESAINFVVPDKKSLEGTDVSDSLKGIDPGILQIMIGMLNDDDSKQTNTYKMCFDGKKLNAGVDGQLKGDVNLWGYEGPPP